MIPKSIFDSLDPADRLYLLIKRAGKQTSMKRLKEDQLEANKKEASPLLNPADFIEADIMSHDGDVGHFISISGGIAGASTLLNPILQGGSTP